ncbi:MAG TPA: rod shape-determining protein RodA [Paludibacteraceae bacterium]|nr:rod shape-determining protein RodA [Paludibacteraceae bacterium]HQB68726.1 rod shape-determining protein RodA [Paludibacteraceae bacterium]
MSRNISIKSSLDWATVILYLVLVFIGWLNVYGASFDYDQTSIFDFSYRSGKQFIWIVCAIGLAGIILLIDSRFFQTFAILFYILMIVLLIVTAVVAPEVKGSRSWLVLGPVSIQPAEFSKFITALALAKVMSGYGFKLNNFKSYLITGFIILLPAIIIIFQKETGSALVYAAFLLVLYREGMPGMIPLICFCCVVLFIIVIRFSDVPFAGVEAASAGLVVAFILILLAVPVLLFLFKSDKETPKYTAWGYFALFALATFIHFMGWISVNFLYVTLFCIAASIIYLSVNAIRFRLPHYWFIVLFLVGFTGYCYSAEYIFERILESHQQMRIKVVLGMENDPRGVGYNVNQAKIAIGSGGFLGKGFLNGTQTKLKYVPEQDTDFIFCTVGEEFGFLGSITVLALYLLFLFRLIHLAERQREPFARIYGYSVVGIFFFHIAINIGMVIGLAPVIGIPLPFFSYGGSSLWAFTFLLFIFLRFDISKTARVH